MIENDFDSAEMALGYATARPQIHSRIVERFRDKLRLERVDVALDIGCGAGLSTRAITGLAEDCLGVDPSASMIRCASRLVPTANFAVARGERLPFANNSINLVTAAGSLNYIDLAQCLAEVNRILIPGGSLVIYDFGQGRTCMNAPSLKEWFGEFLARYPMPVHSAHPVTPEILKALIDDLALTHHQDFSEEQPMSMTSYVDYLLTETNVAQAIREGASATKIRQWCHESLLSIFDEKAKVICFPGHFTCLQKIKQ